MATGSGRKERVGLVLQANVDPANTQAPLSLHASRFKTKHLETVLVGWKLRSPPSLMRTTLHPLTPSLRHPLVIPIPFPNFLFRTSSNYRPDLIDDTAALVRVLDECQSPRSLSALRDLHSRLLDRGLASHPSIQVKIMRAYAACGEPARARSVFDDAPVKTTIFFNVIIWSYVAHRLNREALLLFSEMVRLHRVKPDNYTFPCALKACSDSENLQGGLQIHGAVAKLGLDANLFVGNTLITLYSKCGRSDDAFRSFGERPTWRRWSG